MLAKRRRAVHRLIQFAVAISLAGVVSFPAYGADWPQWLGPERDSVWRESGVIDTIPDEGLPVLWRAPIGWGYSGPAVADGACLRYRLSTRVG